MQGQGLSPKTRLPPHQLGKGRYMCCRMEFKEQCHDGPVRKILQPSLRQPICCLSLGSGFKGLPAGSCLAWAFTAPFLALILTPVSDGLGAACCVDIQQGNSSRGLATYPEAWVPRSMNRRSASATSSKQTTGGVWSQVQTMLPHLLPPVFRWTGLCRNSVASIIASGEMVVQPCRLCEGIKVISLLFSAALSIRDPQNSAR